MDTQKTPAEICEAIAIDLKARGITHSELATMTGKSKAVISTQISGKKRFSKAMASSFAMALGYNTQFLLYGQGELNDSQIPRMVVSVPAGKDAKLDASILASLVQIAGDIIYRTGDVNALMAWEAINKGDYATYMQTISRLKHKELDTVTSSILVRYLCEQIRSSIYVFVKEEDNK